MRFEDLTRDDVVLVNGVVKVAETKQTAKHGNHNEVCSVLREA